MLHPICETAHFVNWAVSLPNRRYYWSDIGCNTALAGSPRTITDRLQRLLNAAARVVSNTGKFDRGLTHLLYSELHCMVRCSTANPAYARSDSSPESPRQGSPVPRKLLPPHIGRCQSSATSIFQPPPSRRTTTSSQHARLSGVLRRRSDGLECAAWRPPRPVAQCRQFQEDAKDASVSECTWTLSALEELRNALYKFKTYRPTYTYLQSSVKYYSTYSVLYRLVGRLGFKSKG